MLLKLLNASIWGRILAIAILILPLVAIQHLLLPNFFLNETPWWIQASARGCVFFVLSLLWLGNGGLNKFDWTIFWGALTMAGLIVGTRDIPRAFNASYDYKIAFGKVQGVEVLLAFIMLPIFIEGFRHMKRSKVT